MFEYIDDNKFQLLRLFEGSVSLESLHQFSYKDTCKFHADSVEIIKHHQKELSKIQSVKKLSNKI